LYYKTAKIISVDYTLKIASRRSHFKVASFFAI